MVTFLILAGIEKYFSFFFFLYSLFFFPFIAPAMM